MADKRMSKLREKIIRMLGGFPELPAPKATFTTVKPVRVQARQVLLWGKMPADEEFRRKIVEHAKIDAAMDLANIMLMEGLLRFDLIPSKEMLEEMELKVSAYVMPPDRRLEEPK